MDETFLPEELLPNSMPALQTAVLGGWLVRLNDGYTYRSNCAAPLRWEAGRGLPAKVGECERLFRRRGMEAVFKVTPPLQPGFSEWLERRGYRRVKTVFVMTAELPGTIPDTGLPVECRARPDEEWLGASAGLLGVPEGRFSAVYRQNMRCVAPASVFASVRSGGRIVGCGYGTAERGFAGAYGLHVAPAFRRRGAGTALLRAAARFGAGNGARTAYLIVSGENRNALALYGRLGFRKSYEYFFYARPGETGITDG